MDESILDKILIELSKRGPGSSEVTDDNVISLGLKSIRELYSNKITFLINKGYISRESIASAQGSNGVYYPARYFLNLTPEGLKFIAEGGFAAKTNYAKKTLTVAKQSRNWAIVSVGIALIALGSQVYYGSCNSPKTSSVNTQLPAGTDSTLLLLDSTNKQ